MEKKKHGRELFFGLKGQPSIPERAGFTGRHQRCSLFGRRQRRELLRHGRIDALAPKSGGLGTDAAVQEEHTVDSGDRRALPDPAGERLVGDARQDPAGPKA